MKRVPIYHWGPRAEPKFFVYQVGYRSHVIETLNTVVTYIDQLLKVGKIMYISANVIMSR